MIIPPNMHGRGSNNFGFSAVTYFDQYFCNGNVLGEMMSQGWDWLIIPAVCQDVFPELPHVVQKALNVSNNARTVSSELEVMVSAAKIAEQQLRGGAGDVDKNVVMENLMESLPSCSNYLGVLVDLALKYGGGPGAPLIVFLDSISKRYGAGKKLGQEFLEAACDMLRCKDCKHCLFQHVRTAVIALNLCEERSQDGYARFLSASDLNRIKASQTVNDAEKVLDEAWKDLSSRGRDTWSSSQVALGRLYLRIALNLIL